MRRRSIIPSISIWLVVAFIVVFYIKVIAIPSFARKYKTSCSTCHEAVSKRNAFGEAFRRNGYFLPIDDAQKIKEKPVKLGAEEWKELWPEAIWPGVLPESFPLAAYAQLRITDSVRTFRGNSRTEFNMPRDLVFLFGGAFGEDVAFFGEWAAYMEGQNALGLFRFFFQFNSVAGPSNLLNIRVGKFEPGITDGYTGTQRLTVSFPITLRYDATGFWKSSNAQAGLEVNGIIQNRIYYAAGVVNGENKTVNDPTDRKDYYGRLAYQFGGAGFNGKDTSYMYAYSNESEKSLTLGVYGYWGVRSNIPLTAISTYNNNFNRFGADVGLHLNRLDILGGLIAGKDDSPEKDLEPLKSVASFVEGNYKIYPWLIGALRLEKANSWKNNEDRDKYICLIPNITLLYRANIRLSAEGVITLNGDRNVKGKTVYANNAHPYQTLLLNSMIAF